MKKFTKLIIAMALLVGFSSLAHAVSLNLSYIKTDYDYGFPANVILEDSSDGIGLTVGFDINSNWSIDLGYSDLGTASRTFLGTPTDFQSSLMTVALHGSTAIGTLSGHTIKLHGLLGVAQGEADLTVGSINLSSTDRGLFYGSGLSLWISPTNAITAIVKKADLSFNDGVNFNYDPTTIELGWTHRF